MTNRISCLCEDCKFYKIDTCTKKNIYIDKTQKECEYFKSKYSSMKVKKIFLKPCNF